MNLYSPPPRVSGVRKHGYGWSSPMRADHLSVNYVDDLYFSAGLPNSEGHDFRDSFTSSRFGSEKRDEHSASKADESPVEAERRRFEYHHHSPNREVKVPTDSQGFDARAPPSISIVTTVVQTRTEESRRAAESSGASIPSVTTLNKFVINSGEGLPSKKSWADAQIIKGPSAKASTFSGAGVPPSLSPCFAPSTPAKGKPYGGGMGIQLASEYEGAVRSRRAEPNLRGGICDASRARRNSDEGEAGYVPRRGEKAPRQGIPVEIFWKGARRPLAPVEEDPFGNFKGNLRVAPSAQPQTGLCSDRNKSDKGRSDRHAKPVLRKNEGCGDSVSTCGELPISEAEESVGLAFDLESRIAPPTATSAPSSQMQRPPRVFSAITFGEDGCREEGSAQHHDDGSDELVKATATIVSSAYGNGYEDGYADARRALKEELRLQRFERSRNRTEHGRSRSKDVPESPSSSLSSTSYARSESSMSETSTTLSQTSSSCSSAQSSASFLSSCSAGSISSASPTWQKVAHAKQSNARQKTISSRRPPSKLAARVRGPRPVIDTCRVHSTKRFAGSVPRQSKSSEHSGSMRYDVEDRPHTYTNTQKASAGEAVRHDEGIKNGAINSVGRFPSSNEAPAEGYILTDSVGSPYRKPELVSSPAKSVKLQAENIVSIGVQTQDVPREDLPGSLRLNPHGEEPRALMTEECLTMEANTQTDAPTPEPPCFSLQQVMPVSSSPEIASQTTLQEGLGQEPNAAKGSFRADRTVDSRGVPPEKECVVYFGVGASAPTRVHSTSEDPSEKDSAPAIPTPPLILSTLPRSRAQSTSNDSRTTKGLRPSRIVKVDQSIRIPQGRGRSEDPTQSQCERGLAAEPIAHLRNMRYIPIRPSRSGYAFPEATLSELLNAKCGGYYLYKPNWDRASFLQNSLELSEEEQADVDDEIVGPRRLPVPGTNSENINSSHVPAGRESTSAAKPDLVSSTTSSVPIPDTAQHQSPQRNLVRLHSYPKGDIVYAAGGSSAVGIRSPPSASAPSLHKDAAAFNGELPIGAATADEGTATSVLIAPKTVATSLSSSSSSSLRVMGAAGGNDIPRGDTAKIVSTRVEATPKEHMPLRSVEPNVNQTQIQTHVVNRGAGDKLVGLPIATTSIRQMRSSSSSSLSSSSSSSSRAQRTSFTGQNSVMPGVFAAAPRHPSAAILSHPFGVRQQHFNNSVVTSPKTPSPPPLHANGVTLDTSMSSMTRKDQAPISVDVASSRPPPTRKRPTAASAIEAAFAAAKESQEPLGARRTGLLRTSAGLPSATTSSFLAEDTSLVGKAENASVAPSLPQPEATNRREANSHTAASISTTTAMSSTMLTATSQHTVIKPKEDTPLAANASTTVVTGTTATSFAGVSTSSVEVRGPIEPPHPPTNQNVAGKGGAALTKAKARLLDLRLSDSDSDSSAN